MMHGAGAGAVCVEPKISSKQQCICLLQISGFDREFQGPVTALAALEGSLLVAWGSRIETHRWTGSRLETTAFP